MTTIGPWTIKWVTPSYATIRGPDSQVIATINTETTADGNNHECNKKTAEDNATLLAAAPTLLLALKHLVNTVTLYSRIKSPIILSEEFKTAEHLVSLLENKES